MNEQERNKVRDERKSENQQNVVVNQPNHEKENRKSKGWIVGIIAVIAIVVIAGMLFLNNDNVGNEMTTQPTEENVQNENEDVNVEAPDVNVDMPDVDTEGIEQSIENGIKEGAEAVTQ